MLSQASRCCCCLADIKTAILVGGMAQQKQRRVLKRGPEIIIATPGRLWDMIREKHPHLMNLRQVRYVTLHTSIEDKFRILNWNKYVVAVHFDADIYQLLSIQVLGH